MNAAAHGRRILLELWRAAVAAVHGRRVVARALRAEPALAARHVVAIGKAAAAMLRGALDVLGDDVAQALLITKPGHVTPFLRPPAHTTVLEAGHPQPDARSLAAGQALLTFLAQVPVGAPVLFLISGGASSLVEVLRPGVTLAVWQRANAWLLGSGLDITQVNAVRKQLSMIKGGGLRASLQGRPASLLFISDVLNNDPATVGSGLLTPGPVALEEATRDRLPAWLAQVMARRDPVNGAAAGAEPTLRRVADLPRALAAAAQHAQAMGYPVHNHGEALTGDAQGVGTRLAAEVLTGPAGLHLWGGETTVRLPPVPGRGGRNQSLALAAALPLAGQAAVLLAAGSDGSDGPTADAGAVVDGASIARGSAAGLDARRCLAYADAGTFLAAAGDLVRTGPTGTNVCDLIFAWRPVQQ